MKKAFELSHQSENIATVAEAFYRGTRIMTAALSATTVMALIDAEPASANRNDVCLETVINDGSTMKQTMDEFSAHHPTENSLSAFMRFSLDRNIGPYTPLAKSVLSICLSPSGTSIEDISVVTPKPNVETAGFSR